MISTTSRPERVVSMWVIRPERGATVAWAAFVVLRASNSSSARGRPWVMSSPATPPVWKVRIVSWVPGSPMDWAAMTPAVVPSSTSRWNARSRP